MVRTGFSMSKILVLMSRNKPFLGRGRANKPKLPGALPSMHPRPPSCITASLTSFMMLQGHSTGATRKMLAISLTLPTNQSFHVFLINRNATVKLSSINTIHVKQQHNLGFFIFKFTLKYMLGNVYIN